MTPIEYRFNILNLTENIACETAGKKFNARQIIRSFNKQAAVKSSHNL